MLVPFLFLQGELRIYYLPLAFAVAFSIVASLFVAFTFVPTMAGRIHHWRARVYGVPGGRDEPAPGAGSEPPGGGAESARTSASAGRLPTFGRTAAYWDSPSITRSW